MENEITDVQSYKLDFNGKGSTFFGIVVLNWLLTVVTLSFYYPWAKVKQLQYLYSSTSLNGDNFSFHGTGKEMFKGYIKALGLFIFIYGLTLLSFYLEEPIIGGIFFYFAIICIIPVAIHGSYRYRFSRTSWRGIRFGYRGNRTELFVSYFKWIFLTIITLGIYASWLEIGLRKYLISNIRIGDVEFKYKGKGGEYFLLNLVGGLLTLVTLGIYSFWFYKKVFAYYVDNMSLYKEGREIKFKSTLNACDIFKVGMVNLLIIIFTLGLGYAWAVTRSLNLIFSKIELEGSIDLNSIQQTEADYNDATGEDISDFLNIDLIF